MSANIMATQLTCAMCGTASTQVCSGCRNAYYCGKEHQKKHWKQGHKEQCKCFEVVSNEVLGRHMRATRDIQQGEIILRESPLICGPKVASAPLCLGCHRRLATPQRPQTNYFKCTKCGWPLCGPECVNLPQHADECELIQQRKFNVKLDYSAEHDTGKKESAYCVILPLRCILLKKKHPNKFQCFAKLEDHLAERINTPLYKVMRANLVTFIRTILGMTDWDEEDILRIAATLDTNCFEVRQPSVGRKVRAIYANAAMISHDCVSNARHTFNEDLQIVFIAKVPIAKGDIIATSYTQPLKSTLLRRTHLSQAKCFDCMCKRCADPLELSLFAGAILCSNCKVGKIISTDPLDNGAKWQCQLCANEFTGKQMTMGNDTMQRALDELDKASPNAFEKFLLTFRHLLHEQNTYVLQVKYALTQLYGNAPGYRLQEMTVEDLKRKIGLCLELLDVAEKLDAGWSIFRGNLLLDLHEATMELTQRGRADMVLTREEGKEQYLNAKKLLEEAANIMRLEPEMKYRLQHCTDILQFQLEMHK